MSKNADFENMLEETIVVQNDKLSKLEPGTKEYDSAVDGLTKLTNLKNEINKTKVNNWAQFWKIAADFGLGIASLLVMIWGTKVSFKFEETGTITTGTGRRIADRLMNAFKR